MLKETTDMTVEERADHEKQWGSYNDFPRGWKQITVEEFAKSKFFSYCPQVREHRQMFDSEKSGGHTDATLYFFADGTGIAMSNTMYDHKINDFRGFWTGEVFYFKFGCEHEWGAKLTKKDRERIGPIFRSTNVVKCKKCKHISVTDSSD